VANETSVFIALISDINISWFHDNSSILKNSILDTERSDECIDFTMMCVIFYLCLCTQREVEIMLQFFTSVSWAMGKWI